MVGPTEDASLEEGKVPEGLMSTTGEKGQQLSWGMAKSLEAVIRGRLSEDIRWHCFNEPNYKVSSETIPMPQASAYAR